MNTLFDHSKFETARQGKELSKAAQELGITYQHLWAIERGTKKPSIELLSKISNLYDVPLDYFFLTKKNLAKV